MLCCCLLKLKRNISSAFSQTNYLSIYRTDRSSRSLQDWYRTFAVDERSEVISFDPSRDVAVANNFVDKIDLQYTLCSSHYIR